VTRRRSSNALVCSALALLLGFPALADAEPSLPGCRAALSQAAYDSPLDLPAATIGRIEAYRLGWRRLCAGERGDVSLYDLLAQARQIELDFGPIFRREAETWKAAEGQGEARWRRAEAIHSLLASKFPAFVPGFIGSFVEWEYFQPDAAFFRKHRSLGDEEDRVFLDAGIRLPGPGPAPNPWFEFTWDYGGCKRFGEFDWVGEIRKIEALRDRLHRDLYRSALVAYERDLYRDLTPRSSLCICDDVARVVPDLEEVSRELAERAVRAETRRAIGYATSQIRAGAISLRSSREGGCSGG
jgi:hypothetical protein